MDRVSAFSMGGDELYHKTLSQRELPGRGSGSLSGDSLLSQRAPAPRNPVEVRLDLLIGRSVPYSLR